MAYLIGTDEAGYGPNLGPLVVAATVWHVPDNVAADADLYALLNPVVVNKPAAREVERCDRLVIGDSKQVYSPRLGLGLLERNVLAAQRVCQQHNGHTCNLTQWSEFWPTLVPRHHVDWEQEPYHADFNPQLPLETCGEQVTTLSNLFAQRLDELQIRLVALQAEVLFPQRFNQMVELCGNKASMLTETALGLVAGLLQDLPPEEALVVCDKHGGRSRYASWLQHCFPGRLVEIHEEGQLLSRYACHLGEVRHRFHFQQGAECHMPAALASMVAKYLREVAMRAFNEFWLRHLPEIRPTAGYPSDAVRFRGEVAVKQQALGISEEVFWRCR